MLNRTRVVYTDDLTHDLIVTNNSDNLYGAQVWIENLDSSISKNFVVAPQLFKINPGDNQIMRMYRTNLSLDNDRESLFWINVQEIPQKSNNESSGLVMAFRNKIKLLYRPNAISKDRYESESKMTWTLKGEKLTIKNPTPYYFAISNVKLDGKKNVTVSRRPTRPFSKTVFDLGGFRDFNSLEVETIDDYGALQVFELFEEKM
ncbi:fimbria/pilus periplasmic chaperone [Vibrio splendidus]|uniref:fimbria/pilus periplasmic chaperone n=1 Tax=Vibrio splendidus TaxID=29497 RepID=UPI0022359914|nr:fimbria/pilus periplasmic chaperone [Vibrio splendidus]MCW4438858.1 fimbria/pilus periplasmic chaperone [Vibrio splendidus]